MAVAAELFSAMVDQQIVPQRADQEKNIDGSGAQGYWRKADGTITFGSYTANGMRSYTRKQHVPLMQYGQFVTAYDATRRWDCMTDPYRVLLEQGGIKEFGQAQIVELGWHRNPHPVLARAMRTLMAGGKTEAEALLMVMPQLEGFERVDVACGMCPGRVFNSEDELARHEVLHREDVQTRRLGDSISQALRGSADANAPILKLLAEAISSLAVGQAENRDALANIGALLAKSQAPAPEPTPIASAPSKSK